MLIFRDYLLCFSTVLTVVFCIDILIEPYKTQTNINKKREAPPATWWSIVTWEFE